MATTSLGLSRLLRRAEAAKHVEEKWGYPCSSCSLLFARDHLRPDQHGGGVELGLTPICASLAQCRA